MRLSKIIACGAMLGLIAVGVWGLLYQSVDYGFIILIIAGAIGLFYSAKELL